MRIKKTVSFSLEDRSAIWWQKANPDKDPNEFPLCLARGMDRLWYERAPVDHGRHHPHKFAGSSAGETSCTDHEHKEAAYEKRIT